MSVRFSLSRGGIIMSGSAQFVKGWYYYVLFGSVC